MNGFKNMLKLDPTAPCDKRSVMLEIKRDDGGWHRLGMKFKCAHDAAAAALHAITLSNEMVIFGVLSEEHIVKLADMRFAYIDDIGVEQEVDDITQAKNILDEIGKMK